jgi:hypothetical protein
MLSRKIAKQNPIVGCLIILVTLVGLLLACFLFCTVIFQLNQASEPTSGINLVNLLLG